jgi:hypothetical protein
MLYLDNAGNVGIGTTDLSGKLHVAGGSGDSSVVLPTDAISADEILDEPGVASTTRITTILLDGTIQTLRSHTIEAPTDGYVLVIGTCEASAAADYEFPTDVNAHFGVSSSSTGFPVNQDVDFKLRLLNNSTCNIPISVHGLFSVAAGSHEFYFLAERVTTYAMSVTDVQFTLVFFPTAHGTVSSTMLDALGSSPADEGATMAVPLPDGQEAAARGELQREVADLRAETDAKIAMIEQRLAELERRIGEEQ